jgi:hypothetical protein
VTVFLVLAAASWGLGTVISKRAVAEIPPFTLLVVQLASSVAALWLATFATRLRAAATADAPPSHTGVLDRLGLLNPGASYALSLVGLSHITASLSVLLWAAEPILILGLAWWWLERSRVGWPCCRWRPMTAWSGAWGPASSGAWDRRDARRASAAVAVCDGGEAAARSARPRQVVIARAGPRLAVAPRHVAHPRGGVGSPARRGLVGAVASGVVNHALPPGSLAAPGTSQRPPAVAST